MYNVVSVPDGDWSVLYIYNNKVYEGHNVDGSLIKAIAENLGEVVNFWEFTDIEEYDGSTPDIFSVIVGLKKTV